MGLRKTRHLQRPAARARPRLSWRRPKVLWRSRNDVLARWFGDPSDAIRRRCVAALRERGTPAAFTVHRSSPEFSFALLGDTGEGDRSQYAVVPPLLHAAADTDFMIVASDVIYPTGDGSQYPEKFFRPYKDYPAPIYAIPGNHDWYDGLRGFLHVFCGLDADCSPPPWRGLFAFVPRLLWRHSGTIDPEVLAEARRTFRGAPGQQAAQPGPYWAIDTPSLRVIGIDTGITGGLDRDQGRWLREVSGGPKPKLLVTGKPLYVDDDHRPGPIEGGGTVDEIVRDPAHHYVAAIGGDIHNYQRYPVRTDDGRTIQYIVSGGGGAFMHATHDPPDERGGGERVSRLPAAGRLPVPLQQALRAVAAAPEAVRTDPGGGHRRRPAPARHPAGARLQGARGRPAAAARASSRPSSASRATAAAAPGSCGCRCTGSRSASARNWPTGTGRRSSRASCAWT